VPEIRPHPITSHNTIDANRQSPPFVTWGMDILGPFPKAIGQCKYLFIAVDYFTKGIKAEAVTSITAVEVQKFI